MNPESLSVPSETAKHQAQVNDISTPYCYNMQELPSAAPERTRVLKLLRGSHPDDERPAGMNTPLSVHISHGLAYTSGSALGYTPPSCETCLSAFLVPNKAGLTAGARAWSKHFRRSQYPTNTEGCGRKGVVAGWWGCPHGPVSAINEKAIILFWRVMQGATWRNLHWLPHQVLVYEVRVPEGYGMRWSQIQTECDSSPWILRGYVEPMIENGHENGWQHQFVANVGISLELHHDINT